MIRRVLITMLALGLATSALAEADLKFKPGKGYTKVSSDGDHKLHIGGRIQARYEYTDFDTDKSRDDESDFMARRVRIWAKGYVFKDWKYKIQADWDRSSAGLKDAVITYARNPAAQISFGQFKVQFDRSSGHTSGRQQFVDRPIAADALGLSRDTGVQIHGNLMEGNKFQYNIGVFDGETTDWGTPTGAVTPTGGANPDDGHVIVARASFHPNGDFGQSQSDIKRSDEHLWFIDVAAAWNESVGASDDDVTRYVAGIGYRYNGWYAQGEYYWEETDFGSSSVDLDAEAWYFQLGYMIQANRWELAARYSVVDPNTDSGVTDDEESEFTVGINRYLWNVGHSLKLQADFSWLDEEVSGSNDLEDFRFRFQAQLVF